MFGRTSWQAWGLGIASLLAVTGFGGVSLQPAVADDCKGSTLTVFWVATAGGKENNGFPILYVGSDIPAPGQQAVNTAASCAGVSQADISISANYSPGTGPFCALRGQTFTKCK